MISVLAVVGFYKIRDWLSTKRQNGVAQDVKRSEPKTVTVYAAFLIVLAVTIVVLVASRVIPDA